MRTVADEATGCDKLAAIVNRRNFVVCGQHDYLMKAADEERIGADDERAAALGKRRESIVDVELSAVLL